MKRTIGLGLALGALVCALVTSTQAADAKFSWRTNATSVALEHESKAVWRFNYGTNNATKPYFHPVALPGGEPLTWESPADHVWHYGLWSSWKYLNGVNYWEENKQRQSDGVTSWRVANVQTRPDFSADIVVELDFRARGAGQPDIVNSFVECPLA